MPHEAGQHLAHGKNLRERVFGCSKGSSKRKQTLIWSPQGTLGLRLGRQQTDVTLVMQLQLPLLLQLIHIYR